MARWMIAAIITLGIHTGAGVAVVSTYHPVKPLLECVESMPDGSFVAHFGYWNRSEEDLTWTVGESNRFLGDVQERGQLTLFASGRSRPFPKAAFKVVSAGDELSWELDGQIARASWNSRPCSVESKAPELPEPTLQKIEPVVEEPKPEPPPKDEPKPTEEAKPKEEAKKESKKEPPPRPRPKNRKRRKKKKSVKKAEPAPLIVANAGDFGSVAVQSGDEDSFGSAAVKTKAPVAEPDETPTVETEPGDGAPAPARKRVLPKATKKVAGIYPSQESGLGRYVTVRLSLRVGATGKVLRVRVLKSGGKAFDKEAIRVAKLMRFKAGTVDGKPEPMSIPWTVEFWPPR